jgi:hypothetical protein
MDKKNFKNLRETYFMLLVGVIVGPIFLLAMAYPLIPTTTMGWLVGAVAGIILGLWAVMSAFAIHWLSRQKRWPLAYKAVALLLALSLGVGIFWIALNMQGFITSNASYFGR